ncbi:hypothetical protein KC19_2G260500, partial [Ceratodon purpureus]
VWKRNPTLALVRLLACADFCLENGDPIEVHFGAPRLAGFDEVHNSVEWGPCLNALTWAESRDVGPTCLEITYLGASATGANQQYLRVLLFRHKIVTRILWHNSARMTAD